MLKIRLARAGRKKNPFFKVVLTEHSRPAQTGFKSVFGWYDPLNHTSDINSEEVRKYIEKGAKPSERVAKILFKNTGDDFFKGFYNETEKNRSVKNKDK
ncbi:30S ribosomal protein S16 [Candidatus Vampirococcus lugosii]|uniref:Small ribosomal subunit protein bS16 n=1 Tax=Candidatus Vampirococcus lugosii TaxID=2789015 RepID=A0ABS5QJZ4_9BACT|nr:30S ribosomal protein S16 [Candidatus Vampirococcus lugosii]MBS8121585.1 30S ribosomal protein S16 [Candidatus Vampirococcus lugosii]